MKKVRYYIALSVLFIAVSGCENFVEVELPSSQLNAADVFENKSTADAAMGAIYASMRDTGMLTGNASGVYNQMGVYADELLAFGGTSGISTAFYNNALTGTDAQILSWWSDSYNQIYRANALMEGVVASTALQQADKEQLKGEALFVRALLHFYLANLYGNVPYIKTTDYRLNAVVLRTQVDDIHDLAITDLEEAVALLPEAFVAADRTRPNRATAYALLARIYLYAQRWAEAAEAASVVLNDPTFTWESDLEKVFLKESTATLWQFLPNSSGQNTMEGETFIFISGPPPLVALRGEVVDAFEMGDRRLTAWVASVTDGTATWYHANKYKQRGIGDSSQEYSIVFRLSEMYLIRAEARVRQMELVNAKGDLDFIRNTAGLGESTAVTQQGILEAILRERRVELFTEAGHRFFDLKRYGLLDAVLGSIKPGWNETDRLLPLPESELLLNPALLPQNAGY